MIPSDEVEAILTVQAGAQRLCRTCSQLVAFHAAFTKPANILSPVTAGTIRACASKAAARTLMRNRTWAVCLTIGIVILSIIAFVDSYIATKPTSDIADANAGAVKLRAAPGTLSGSPEKYQCSAITTPSPAGFHNASGLDDLTQFQQFAAGLRGIYGKAIKLNYFVAKIEYDPLATGANQS